MTLPISAVAQLVLEATSNQGLIKHSAPGGRNSRKKAAYNTPDNFAAHKCTSLDNNKVLADAHATAHVSRHILKMSPHISAIWDKHPDGATIRDSISSRELLWLPSMATAGMRLLMLST